jgi:hypothetical protein
MSRLIMLSCAAFLRVYEPLSAFSRKDRERWQAYASSPDKLPRAEALEAEREQALRRIIALPPIVAPRDESEQAYVRRAQGVTYVCPWQSRLRSWLALERLRATAGPLLADAFGTGLAEIAAENPARRGGKELPPRVYIQSSTWSVPVSWFVPFAPAERWLVAGAAGDRGRAPATARATRALIYVTQMAQARRRVARALDAIRRASGKEAENVLDAGQRRGRSGLAAIARAGAELEEVGRWLEEFHPHSLVELDYGGLVQLVDDDALRADQSVAEVSAAVSALANKEFDLAATMYLRLRARWQQLEAIGRGS